MQCIKHKEDCFIRYPNTVKWVKKNMVQPRFFLTNFSKFGYLMKHPFECLIWLLKALIILKEIQSKPSDNFMIIRITYPNLLSSNDFLYFLLISD